MSRLLREFCHSRSSRVFPTANIFRTAHHAGRGWDLSANISHDIGPDGATFGYHKFLPDIGNNRNFSFLVRTMGGFGLSVARKSEQMEHIKHHRAHSGASMQ